MFIVILEVANLFAALELTWRHISPVWQRSINLLARSGLLVAQMAADLAIGKANCCNCWGSRRLVCLPIDVDVDIDFDFDGHDDHDDDIDPDTRLSLPTADCQQTTKQPDKPNKLATN